jgi:hypothetical protein
LEAFLFSDRDHLQHPEIYGIFINFQAKALEDHLADVWILFSSKAAWYAWYAWWRVLELVADHADQSDKFK